MFEMAVHYDIQAEREKYIMVGMQKGIEKGIKKRNIEIALELLKNGVDMKLISLSTGLSGNELLRLKRELES